MMIVLLRLKFVSAKLVFINNQLEINADRDVTDKRGKVNMLICLSLSFEQEQSLLILNQLAGGYDFCFIDLIVESVEN